MKRILAIFLTFVMIFSCSYTAMANIYCMAGIKIVNGKSVNDISLLMKEKYVTDDGVLMVPAEAMLKHLGFDYIEKDTAKKILSAARTSDMRKLAYYYDGSSGVYAYSSPGFTETKNAEMAVKPVVVNGVTMLAIKELAAMTGDKVYVDVSTGSFYVVKNGSVNVDPSITSLPQANGIEAAIVQKYAPSKAKANVNVNTAATTNNNAFRVNVVTTSGTTDITATANAQMVNGKLMVAVKPVLQAFGASVVWTPSLKTITSYTDDSRLITIPFDGSRTVRFQYDNKQTATLDVAPKLINGTAMMYYGDFSYLLGSVSNYDPTKKIYNIVAVDALTAFTFGNSTASNSTNTTNNSTIANNTKTSNPANDDLVSPEQFSKNKALQKAYFNLACDLVRPELDYWHTAKFSPVYLVTKKYTEKNGWRIYVDGFVTSQTKWGTMKSVPFNVFFNVDERTVDAIFIDGELHYELKKMKIVHPSYSLKGYYY